MKKYKLLVRINSCLTIYTMVFADEAYMAKELGETMYGVGNVLNYTEVQRAILQWWALGKYLMRFYEFNSTPTIKPLKPMSPKQYRLYSLKRNKDNAKQAYKAEKDRQTVAKAQQQIFKATH